MFTFGRYIWCELLMFLKDFLSFCPNYFGMLLDCPSCIVLGACAESVIHGAHLKNSQRVNGG